jgi:hypothetical protein
MLSTLFNGSVFALGTVLLMNVLEPKNEGWICRQKLSTATFLIHPTCKQGVQIERFFAQLEIFSLVYFMCFAQKGLGYILGNFFRELIWSPYLHADQSGFFYLAFISLQHVAHKNYSNLWSDAFNR